MVYEIQLRRSAQKELDAVRGPAYSQLARAINKLANQPRPPRVRKLAGGDLWRLRVGSYRLVYAVDDSAHLVIVVRVARRREDTYRGLQQA